jgi:hypothetical protein
VGAAYPQRGLKEKHATRTWKNNNTFASHENTGEKLIDKKGLHNCALLHVFPFVDSHW